ncbi:MAG TPA: MFS transporter [Nitrososphaerales archaeon]|nr:MFS transporter [Nitrososphaerales archaeon]
MMIGTETTRAAIFAIMTAAVVSHMTPLPLVYTVAASVGGLGGLFDISSDALVPTIVVERELLRANSLFNSFFQANSIVGPALAGLTIAAFGTSVPFLLDSISFVVLVFAVLLIKLPTVVRGVKRQSWATQFREGFRYFRNRTELIMISVLTSGLNFGLGAFWYVYTLVFATFLGAGSLGYGLFGTASSLGTLISVLYLSRRGKLQERRLAVVVSTFFAASGIVLTSFARTLPEALTPIFVFGVALPFFDVVGTTYYQETVPTEMLGRALGFRRFIDYISAPISIGFGGFMVSYVGIAHAILFSGMVMLACAIVAALSRSLKRLDRKPTDEHPEREAVQQNPPSQGASA